MGCKDRINPVKAAKRAVKGVGGGVKQLAKGNFKKSFKALKKGDLVFTTLEAGDKRTKTYGKKALANPYVATAVGVGATAYGGPAAGAAVMSASGAIQAKQAMDQAQDAMKSIEAGFADPVEEAVQESVTSVEDQVRRRRRRKDVGLSSLIRTGPRGLFAPAMNAMAATSNKLGA